MLIENEPLKRGQPKEFYEVIGVTLSPWKWL